MRKPLALSAYLALRQHRNQPLGDPPPRRPKGPLVWVHCENPARLLSLSALHSLLTDEGDQVTMLVTSSAQDPQDGLTLQPIPEDSQPAVRAFLNHWRPDVMVWLDGPLRPALIAQAADRPMTRIILDVTGSKPEALQRVPGLARAVLSLFSVAVCADRSGVQRLETAGLPASSIRQAQPFDPSPRVQPCDEAERSRIAAHLGARPIWLAAQPSPAELPAIVAAQKRASRRSHRLMLIIACPDHITSARILDTLDLPYHRYSAAALPPEGTQLLLVDPRQMGLWYRLAPLTFIGGTLTSGATLDPFQAAALGSVVIHGPITGSYGTRFDQLEAATACLQTESAETLGDTIETLLSPDKAAAYAHAAWDVTSRGAETAQMVAELILDALDHIGG